VTPGGEPAFDVAVIGGGPGGYVAAIRAAQSGLSVCLIERDELGGVCLNWGCIPSKSLIDQATDFKKVASFENYGLKIDRTGFRYADVHAQSRKAARTLSNGISALMKKNGIDVIKASATLNGSGTISLSSGEDVTALDIILATGSRAATVMGFEVDEYRILSSTGILAMDELPESIAIIGAGAVGCEFAYVMNAFGVQTTLLEVDDQVLPLFDRDSSNVIERAFTDGGIDVYTSTRAVGWEAKSRGLELTVAKSGNETTLSCEKVLVAAGRIPNSSDLGLESAGVKCDSRGFVEVGPTYLTSAANIYAIGDLVETPALAHVASKEAEIAVNEILGKAVEPLDLTLIPSVVYCEPQVASIGLSEDQVIAHAVPYRVNVFPFYANGKAVAIGSSDGHVKLLTDPNDGELLGAHIVGHGATEIIHELLLTRASETAAPDLATMVHAHPTFSEAIMEAAASINDQPIHV
jgi:dihydrolipoamide dehydrogenase